MDNVGPSCIDKTPPGFGPRGVSAIALLLGAYPATAAAGSAGVPLGLLASGAGVL